MFPSPRRIAGPVVLGCYRGCPDALSKQASPVSVLTRSARSKHITCLCRLGEGGGRTLISGQLQSSPAPFSQPGGEFLCQHTHTHTRTPSALQTPLSLTYRAESGREEMLIRDAPGLWLILFTLARVGGNKRVAGFACICVRQTALALAAKLPRQGADDQSYVC